MRGARIYNKWSEKTADEKDKLELLWRMIWVETTGRVVTDMSLCLIILSLLVCTLDALLVWLCLVNHVIFVMLKI